MEKTERLTAVFLRADVSIIVPAGMPIVWLIVEVLCLVTSYHGALLQRHDDLFVFHLEVGEPLGTSQVNFENSPSRIDMKSSRVTQEDALDYSCLRCLTWFPLAFGQYLNVLWSDTGSHLVTAL